MSLSAESMFEELPILLSHYVECASELLVNSLLPILFEEVVLFKAYLRIDCR
jgi:hypothetical protein